MLVAAVCLSALSLCATENADAKETFFIVYQSGGKITPFLDTEIDSIGFSKFDTDSVEHPNGIHRWSTRRTARMCSRWHR